MRLFPSPMTTLNLTTVLWRASARRSFTFPSSSKSYIAFQLQGRAFSGGNRRAYVPASYPLLAASLLSSSPPFSSSQFSTDKHSVRKPTNVFQASSADTDIKTDVDSSTAKKPIPVILLAGFLGSGKTTTLKSLLENNQNIKIGTVVNDVAEVNIDAKLISNSDTISRVEFGTAPEAVVELQNGCACCSLADELFTSVMRLTDGGNRELDAIVVELSGVADPVAVRDNWDEAKRMEHPATKIAELQRTVTLVDACTFGTDWMSWDTAGDRESWTQEGDDFSAVRNVPELLAEQVEAADLLLVNKIDMAGERQVKVASGVARGLNEKATVLEVEFGRVSVNDILGNVLDQHQKEGGEFDDGHSRGHAHSHSAESTCADPTCTDSSHSHEHAHDHTRTDSTCTENSHTHSHGDSSHSHSHDHGESCTDPDCTDTSHSHSHDHKPSTSTEQLGISSFVYKTPVPFNTQRLLALLNRWPIPIKDSLELGLESVPDDSVDNRAFAGVLRSKGFCWMAPMKWTSTSGSDAWRHDTAMYWSHAGKHFGITTAGKWWSNLTKDQMKSYFANNMNEYERIMKEDWISEEWGDRRQELVFIGSKLDEAEIRAALDTCLCTEEEMDMYRMQLQNYLNTAFTGAASGPSLFDVGSVGHVDQ
ncbi:hypothetical protein ACHAXS_014441 [Conticribra weissflogii]